ncbi:ethanolamine ammonia-lyase subunit EutC [Kistimonas asteriae]|uniref:ethanolamine ammonia-lyase subunit EutC n=1 Tax=Kistimonas asteriae TaxID=517724 RepID=UPI001BA6FD29|nr:ethanolamine ammonia-lyase subunit EutC [Kistimonas asteriae]
MSSQPPTKQDFLIDNPWQSLRRHTDARIGLGRSGVSLPTDAHLSFQLAHARARDAVHIPLAIDQLEKAIRAFSPVDIWSLKSRTADRATYLQRPDLGRLLSRESEQFLRQHSLAEGFDIAVVIVDGLSSTAVQHHAPPMLEHLLSAIHPLGYRCAPICLVTQGRVAVGDPIGELLNARLLVMMIGERPGLSSPDSLGIYFTWQPQSGKTDAQRNCISNIRHEGLSYEEATHKLMYLMQEADRRQLSGVYLKDETDAGEASLPGREKTGNLLINRHKD